MFPESFSSFITDLWGYIFLFILDIINSYREHCVSEYHASVKIGEK